MKWSRFCVRAKADLNLQTNVSNETVASTYIHQSVANVVPSTLLIVADWCSHNHEAHHAVSQECFITLLLIDSLGQSVSESLT